MSIRVSALKRCENEGICACKLNWFVVLDDHDNLFFTVSLLLRCNSLDIVRMRTDQLSLHVSCKIEV